MNQRSICLNSKIQASIINKRINEANHAVVRVYWMR